MVQAKALKELKDSNGHVYGFKLRDENGLEMDIKCSDIINAMRNNLINIINLSITNDNKLVMKEDKQKNIVTNEQKHEEVNSVSENVGGSIDDSEKVHQLVKKLNIARKAYYTGEDEIMSNFEYDKLYDELVELEKKTGIVLSNSPTINVGYEVVSNLPKEKHSHPMLSLEKTKDRDALAGFLQGREGVLSWKLDGLTVVLHYENGDLVKGVTRGNGEIGEIITPNVKQFKNVPRHIAFKGKLVLRGEAVIRYSTFDKINASLSVGEEQYKNPRNLCSGSVRQLDSKVTAQRDVEWYCFEVVECEGKTLSKNVDEQFNFVKILGFEVVDYKLVNPSTMGSAVSDFESKVINKSYDIPSDGLVLTFRDKEFGKSLGHTAKSPRHSIAFKWQDETAITRITGIEWQVGKSGVITPVAEFEPVDLEGSTISRASVHNVSILSDLELGIGDRVSVYKANLIIPQISDNFDRTATCRIPSICPCCGCETEMRQDPRSDVLTLWCPNDDCEAKGNRLLKHFVSRNAMNIDGISGSTLEKLAEAGIITDFASVFRIGNHPEIAHMEGFGATSFYNMVGAIDKARNVKLHNLIYALGIPNVGLQTAKIICKNFNNDLKDTVTASYASLASIEGVGDVIASNFYDYFHTKENVEQFTELLKELNVIKEEVIKADANDPINGKVFCVTGAVYRFPNRDAVKALIESRGGKLTGSVSRSTNYLITNDTTSGSRKNKAAQEYGIPILTEDEFITKFNISI